jgi:hypothetical protein
MNRREVFAFAVACIAFGAVAQSVDKQDPSGTWKWSETREDNVVVESSLELKYMDGKLSGTMTLPSKKKIEIEDASFKDDEVKFTIKQEGAAKRTVTAKFKGKLDGDAIKGSYESDTRIPRDRTGTWEPKRQKS